jgi:uncharacterized protein
MADQKSGNPAVVGLAGFGITTLVLQFHNVGWMGIGPVVWLALIFGGLAQLVAGFQESKTGNNFGYCAFVGYGSFWISVGLLLIGNHYAVYPSSGTDLGWFFVGWTVFTAILWVPAMRISTAHAVIFTLLLTGFILLDFTQFGNPALKPVAGYELIATALSALYLMAHIIFGDVFGRDLLPIGNPWIGAPAVSSGTTLRPAEIANAAKA